MPCDPNQVEEMRVPATQTQVVHAAVHRIHWIQNTLGCRRKRVESSFRYGAKVERTLSERLVEAVVKKRFSPSNRVPAVTMVEGVNALRRVRVPAPIRPPVYRTAERPANDDVLERIRQEPRLRSDTA